MKKYQLLLFILVGLIHLSLVQGNEIEVSAKHGGILQKTENVFLEVVQDKDKAKAHIYITGHDHKNIVDKSLSLSAIAHIKGKQYPIALSYENDHYSTSPVNSYLHGEKNYVLMLTISFSGKVEKVSFPLEK